MRVEIVDDEKEKPGLAFPEIGHSDPRDNPSSIESVGAPGRYLPLRNFLAAVNTPDSVFIVTFRETRANWSAGASAGPAYEFASQAFLLFADTSLNLKKDHFTDLSLSLKKLLERDSTDSVRAALRISPCEFSAQNRRGFALIIRLVGVGDSSQQAEMRWGLGLARLQQALLFQARALKQQTSK